MKKYLLIICFGIFSVLIFWFSSYETTYAYNGGLLEGRNFNSSINMDGTVITGLTDNNLNTSVSFDSPTSMYDSLNSPSTIYKYYYKGVGGINVIFLDSANKALGNLILQDSVNGSFYNISPVNNVAKIKLVNGTGSTKNMNEFDVYTIPVENVTGLNVEHSATSAFLSWSPINDTSNLDKYHIYKDNAYIGDTSDNSYVVNGLSPDTSYTFKVTSYYLDKTESSGTSATVRTDLDPSKIPPDDVTSLDYENLKATSLDLKYVLPSDVDFDHVEIYKNGNQIGVSSSSGYHVSGLIPNTSYDFKIVAVDVDGNKSTGKFITIQTPDDTDMTPPEPVILSGVAGNGFVSLNWKKGSDTDIKGFDVYLNGTKVNSDIITSYSYVIDGLNNDTTYDVYVKAIDNNNNISDNSNIVSLKPVATGLPLLKFTFTLADVSNGISSWFSSLWLLIAFATSIPLSFVISHRVKNLFLS